GGLVLGALGDAGWRAAVSAAPNLRNLPLPPVVRPVLPALFDLEGVTEIPHLSYRRRGVDPDSVGAVSVVFRPPQGLAGAGFQVLSPRFTRSEAGRRQAGMTG